MVPCTNRKDESEMKEEVKEEQESDKFILACFHPTVIYRLMKQLYSPINFPYYLWLSYKPWFSATFYTIHTIPTHWPCPQGQHAVWLDNWLFTFSEGRVEKPWKSQCQWDKPTWVSFSIEAFPCSIPSLKKSGQ